MLKLQPNCFGEALVLMLHPNSTQHGVGSGAVIFKAVAVGVGAPSPAIFVTVCFVWSAKRHTILFACRGKHLESIPSSQTRRQPQFVETLRSEDCNYACNPLSVNSGIDLLVPLGSFQQLRPFLMPQGWCPEHAFSIPLARSW